MNAVKRLNHSPIWALLVLGLIDHRIQTGQIGCYKLAKITVSIMSDHKKKIKVWDLPTRIFHWSLVVLVATALVTGFLSPEWWMDIHIWAGYGIIFLIIFRLVWGVFGSEFSRFKSFAFTPGVVLTHIRKLIILRPLHYIGHNPAGAMMIIALIFFLFSITISGFFVLGGQENQGPLAGVINYKFGHMAGELHEVMAFILMGLIALHIIGVIIETRLSRENLVKSMIDGYKTIPEDKTAPKIRPARPLAAAAVLLVFTVLASSALWVLSSIPPSGIISLTQNKEYSTECGDCHEVYHPSLLPKTSWAKMMSGLEDHFGEDASLDKNTAAHITTYLEANAAEAWDTEASNRFSKVSSDAPYQITATRYWQRKHREIGADIFKRKSVGGKSHCASCHLDAASGRFDDQQINIPN